MDYYAIYSGLVKNATFGQVEQASKWYVDAEKVAHEVARNLETSLENGASVVSAFSPRERWTTNVAKAIAFSLGEKPVGLSNNLRMAENAKFIGYDALKGMKTNAFAKAIAGDEQAVVIDVWMLRAVGIEKKTPNQSQYNELANAVKKTAFDYGMTPRAMQALIWIVVRGSGE
jgi:thermostable 8-oxoguanine DNA glycosylase